MRHFFTYADALQQGISRDGLAWGLRTGKWIRVARDVYAGGSEPATELDRATALAVVTGGVAVGTLAGTLHELDSVELSGPYVCVPPGRRSDRVAVSRRQLPRSSVVLVDGIPCTDGLTTIVDLAAKTDDLTWEQMLESALRKRLTTVSEIDRALVELARQRVAGTRRIRRVLAARPPGAPPTESLLETLMVQLIRIHTDLPIPQRQVVVENRWGEFVARVDLAWPDHGIFLELDGSQHEGQPLYDAKRQTNVVAAKGWKPGRFTWHEVTRVPRTTARRLEDLFASGLYG